MNVGGFRLVSIDICNYYLYMSTAAELLGVWSEMRWNHLDIRIQNLSQSLYDWINGAQSVR